MIKQHVTLGRQKDEFYASEKEDYKKFLTKFFGYFTKNYAGLRTIDIHSLDMYAVSCFCAPGNPEARQYLKNSLEAAYAFFRLATEQDLNLTFRIGEHQAELKSAYTDRHLQILGPYEYDLYKALILRHHEALHYLLQVDLRVHFREKPYTNENHNALAAFTFVYKALFNRRKYLGSVFALAKRAFTSQGVSYTVAPVYDSIALIELMLSGGSEADFNLRFEKALLDYQAECKKDKDTSWRSAMALPLAAVAALAHDQWGYRVTVENEYIPQWIVEDTDGEQPWKLGEKTLDYCPSKELNLDSEAAERAYLQQNDLYGQMEHIEYYLEHLFLGDEPLQAMEAMHPHLWHIFLNKTAWQFGADGTELRDYIQTHLDPIARELHDLRSTVNVVKL